MDIRQKWEKALKNTEIKRNRIQELDAFSSTLVPYIFLGSGLPSGGTVTRKGQIIAEKPSLILPTGIPQLEGFDFGEDFSEDQVINFLLIRGVRLPSLRYNHKSSSRDTSKVSLEKEIERQLNRLQRKEDVETALIVGPEECWQYSVLIFVANMVSRTAHRDIKRLLEKYRKGS